MTSNEPHAGTPPAEPPAQGGQQPPVTPPAQPPGIQQQPPSQEFIMTQEQFNKRFAEKMGAIEAELGLPQGGLKDFVAAQKAAQKPKPPTGETLSGADLKIAKMEALMAVGVPSQQIPIILQHFNIAGKTREEIQGSILQLIDAKLLTIAPPAEAPPAPPGTAQQQPPGRTGAGSNPPNQADPGKKTWKKSEIQSLLKDPTMTDPEILKDINLAQREGRIDYNS